MTKKIMLFFAFSAFLNATTVTGTLIDLSRNPKNSFVRIELKGYEPNIPRVIPTNVIVPPSVDVFPDVNGNITTTIQDDTLISPSGTYYRVSYFRSGRVYFSNIYDISGSSFDLNSAIPLTTPPVPVPPTADLTYQRLDGGNKATGNYVPNIDSIDNIGSPTSNWKYGYFNSLKLRYLTVSPGCETSTGQVFTKTDKNLYYRKDDCSPEINLLSTSSVVNVEDYGAVGNGTTDDSAAFTAAFASGNTNIHADKAGAKYLTSSTVTMASGQRLLLGTDTSGPRWTHCGIRIPDSNAAYLVGNVVIEGISNTLTTIKLKDGCNTDGIANTNFYTLIDSGNQYGTQNVVLRNLQIDGNKANQTMVTRTIIGATNATPIEVQTSVAHGYSTGNVVFIKLVKGNEAATGMHRITVTTVDKFTLDHSKGSGAYTSGGTVTNQHMNGIAIYGIGPLYENVISKNNKGAGLVSGWNVEPPGGYVTLNNQVQGFIRGFKGFHNDFDGMIWHGPHDIEIDGLDLWSNGGFGLHNETDPTATVYSGVINARGVGTYGNDAGGCFIGASIRGVGIACTSTNDTLPSTGTYGMFQTSLGSSSMMSASIFAGSPGAIGMSLAGVTNKISGKCISDGVPCIVVREGYGHDLDIDCELRNGAYCLSVTGSTASSKYNLFGVLVPASGSAMLDPGNLPRTEDEVRMSTITPLTDVITNRTINQQEYTMATGTAPLKVTSTTPVANLTTDPNCGSFSGNQLPNCKLVIGAVTIGGGGNTTVTLTSPYTFPGNNYYCVGSDAFNHAPVAADIVTVSPVNTTTFIVNGTAGHTAVIICAGR